MKPFKLYGKLAAEIKERQTFTATKSSFEGKVIAILTPVDEEFYTCTECGFVKLLTSYKNCPGCGQDLDWSDA